MRAYRHLTTAALLVALITPAIAADAISGDVKKIDEANSKITLHHGPAKSLGMDEAMTMVYRVKDAAMLKGLKTGDKVKFEAQEDASGYTVTKIEKGK
ncbi:copper-binding protein [Bradyrhizobium sp. HKCCYLR20261]|uniref:copper-binding protein n=1 Tax=unclassified Bradyrhizobium TaxID=2631580 RepID=UPI003EBE780E